MKEIPGAAGYLFVDDARNLGQVIIHPHINDAQSETMLTAEHIHTATTMREVNHLLPCDITGRHADTLPLYAVVTT